jgi:hypothetical protein
MDKSIFNMLVGGNSSLQQTSEPYGFSDSITNIVGGRGQSVVQGQQLPEHTEAQTYEALPKRYGSTGQRWGEKVGTATEKVQEKQKYIMVAIYALVAITLIVLSGILFAQGSQNKEILWSIWAINIMFTIGNALLIFFDKVKPLQMVIGILQFAFYIWVLSLAAAKNFSCENGNIYKIYIATHSLNVGMFLITIINAALPSTN